LPAKWAKSPQTRDQKQAIKNNSVFGARAHIPPLDKASNKKRGEKIMTKKGSIKQPTVMGQVTFKKKANGINNIPNSAPSAQCGRFLMILNTTTKFPAAYAAGNFVVSKSYL